MYKAKQRLTTLLLACFAVLVSVLLALTLWTTPTSIHANAASTTIEDTLNRATTGITGTSYSTWSGKTSNSDAVYAGQSAGGNSSIQLRSSNSNSGIVTTASGGKIKKVTVEWNSNSASGRTLNVYASTSAYTNPTELYGSSPKGTKVGTIVNGTSTKLEITGDYTYVGVRSNSGALYLDSITFTWEVEVASTCAHDYQLKGENGKHIMTCTKCGEVQENAVEENCIGSNWSTYSTDNGVHSRTGDCTLCGASVTESGKCEISAEYVREGNQHTKMGTCNICQASTSVTEDCTLTTDGYAPLDTDNKAEQQHAVTTTCSVCEETATANENCSFDKGVLDGSTRTYTCQYCEYSYSEEVTLYTVNYVVSGGTAPESQSAVANETVTLPDGDDYNEYTFIGWTTESLNDETNEAPDYTKTGDTYEVTGNVTFYALYSKTEGTGDWTKVTDVNKLAVGYEIVIVASGSNDALSTTQNTSNRASVTITKNGDTVTINESVQIITLETGKANNTYAFKVDDGYLYAASSGSNHLKTQATLDANGSWLITISSNGVATIKAQGTNTRNWLRKNSSSALFSCYGSGQNDVSIYMKSSSTSYVTAEGTCDHTYEIDEENSQPKTCTENGLEIKICTKCGDRNEETLFATGHVEVHTIISEATCKEAGSKTITCENCSELNETIELPLLPHDYQGGKCTVCGEKLPVQATLTFDDTAKRTEFSTEKQVWMENSIILTNNKANSTNAVADYANPVRFYKSSTLTIEYPQMLAIVFTCNTTAYAEDLQASIGETATINGKIVTVKFAEPQDSFTITLSGQVRMDSLTVATEPTINSASVTIGEDITLNCYVSIADTLYADATLVFTMNDNNLDVKGELGTDGRYKFSLELPPQYMTDTVQIFLYHGSEEIEKIENYSIQAYAKNQFDKAGENAELKRLISDMLHYGAAAQIYKGYNVENLANDVDGILSETEDAPETTNFTLSEVANGCPAYFTGAGVHFDNVNKLYVKLSTTENVTLTINGTQVEDLSTKIYTDGISVTAFAEPYTFVLSYDDGNGQTATQALTYSINAYAYAKKDAENVAMKNLALALYRYGVSAETYAA